MDDNLIPETYEQWKHCITVLCGIKLTKKYLEKRIAIFTDKSNYETRKFIQLYGEKHTNQVLDWFVVASNELENN